MLCMKQGGDIEGLARRGRLMYKERAQLSTRTKCTVYVLLIMTRGGGGRWVEVAAGCRQCGECTRYTEAEASAEAEIGASTRSTVCVIVMVRRAGGRIAGENIV